MLYTRFSFARKKRRGLDKFAKHQIHSGGERAILGLLVLEPSGRESLGISSLHRYCLGGLGRAWRLAAVRKMVWLHLCSHHTQPLNARRPDFPLPVTAAKRRSRNGVCLQHSAVLAKSRRQTQPIQNLLIIGWHPLVSSRRHALHAEKS